MFRFITFFAGREVSSVENINHDQSVELLFEALSQVKQDSRWSFTMKRFIPLLLLLLGLGCATGGRSLEVNGMNLQQQLEAYIDDYSNQVLDQCIEIHGAAKSGRSGIDCAFVGLEAMHLSFASVAHHNAVRLDVQRLEYHWCASAQSKTGKTARWVLHFRKENVIRSRPCYKGDQLVALGRHVEAQAANR